MLIGGHLRYDLDGWATWLAPAAGLVAAFLMYVVLTQQKKRQRLVAFANGDLPWEVLVEMLRARHRELASSGSPPEEDLPPDELLTLLLSRLPAMRRRAQQDQLDRREYLGNGGAERRSNDRRWSNPIEVNLSSLLWLDPLHGLVINRSAGGFAIFVDKEIAPSTILSVSPLEAPHYIKVQIEVVYCRRVRKNFLIGCQCSTEMPWNVLVWFG